MKKSIFHLLFTLLPVSVIQAQENVPIPDTGISGVYEVIVGTDNAENRIAYFREFGFHVTDSASLSAEQAKAIYGVASALRSFRLQNGDIDSHGLLRILEWEKPSGPGIGYTAPETIGRRMAVMRTRDIFRLTDIFRAEREKNGFWTVIEPVFDDLYGMSAQQPDFFNRPVGVRETAVYGKEFAHVFFQRYGYHIPGYGTIHEATPLQTSEFTHHDFVIKASSMDDLNYLTRALGLRAEGKAEIDGDWRKGPKRVFDMPEGYSHLYQGFVSPNNICGKIKIFIPQQPVPDQSEQLKTGALGITLHSLYTPYIKKVHELVIQEGVEPTAIRKNEFGERSFIFTGPGGISWQIIEKTVAPAKEPVRKLEFQRVNH